MEFLKPYDPRVAELALALRRVVLEEAPAASEIVYDAYNAVALGYTFTGRFKEAFCHVAVYSGHVNLGFNHGAELEDPEGLLEGTGKQVRHLRVEKSEGLRRTYVRRFLRAAIEQVRQIRSPEKNDQTVPTTVVKASVKKRRPKRDA